MSDVHRPPPAPLPGPASEPLLSGIVVHWRDEEGLAALVVAWPDDPSFELVVVDNGSTRSLHLPDRPHLRLLSPGENLGFAGGVNAGVAAARAPLILLLNPDAAPEPGALDELLRGFAALPDAAGLAPRLFGADGSPQFRWQLRPLPTAWDALLQALAVPAPRGPRTEPAAGTVVEQPAAAALILRREALAVLGGLDAGFHPAWFEDVDLAQRLHARGMLLRYWPAAVFRHAGGATVPKLGYGTFLWLYYRSLDRYLAKHHGGTWARAIRGVLALGLIARLLLLPLRRPQRAASRAEAARGLLDALAGALSRWQQPSALAARYPAAAAALEVVPA